MSSMVKYGEKNAPGEVAVKTGGIVTAVAVVAGFVPVINTWEAGVAILGFGVFRYVKSLIKR